MRNPILRVNDPCGPIIRGELYRKPLDDLLEREGLGEVCGGGTQLSQSGAPVFCELELSVELAAEDGIEKLRGLIDRIGVPKGSLLVVDENQTIPVGNLEGVMLNYRYNEPPDEVYESVDMEEFHKSIGQGIEGAGKAHDEKQGAELYQIYFYGQSGMALNEAIAKFLSGHILEKYINIVLLSTDLPDCEQGGAEQPASAVDVRSE